jgi:hypothetical protein
LFDVQEKPSLLPGKISVLFVTSQNESADHLSALLGKSRVNIEVEWVDTAHGTLETVKQRLALKTSEDPSIVLLDYRTYGPDIWPFIVACVGAMPRHKIEWLVSHYTGSVPVMPGFPWRQVTIIGDNAVNH